MDRYELMFHFISKIFHVMVWISEKPTHPFIICEKRYTRQAKWTHARQTTKNLCSKVNFSRLVDDLYVLVFLPCFHCRRYNYLFHSPELRETSTDRKYRAASSDVSGSLKSNACANVLPRCSIKFDCGTTVAQRLKQQFGAATLIKFDTEIRQALTIL